MSAVEIIAPPPMSELDARIQRAYDRARDHIRRGVVPLLLDSTLEQAAIVERWAIASATRDNLSWVVELKRDIGGITTTCQCEAAQRNQLCWHRAAARLAHLDTVRVSIACRVRYRVKPGIGPAVW